MKVAHSTYSKYMVDVQAPESVKTFAFKMYQRTRSSGIEYKEKATEFSLILKGNLYYF